MEVRRTAPLERPAAGRDSAELIAAAASILRGEASALSSLADALDESFSAAVAAILTCRGQVLVRRARQWSDSQQMLAGMNAARQMLVHSLIDVQVANLLDYSLEVLSEVAQLDSTAVREVGSLLGFTPLVRDERRELEQFLFDNVYRHADLVEVRARAAKRLKQMFDLLCQTPERLPERFHQRVSRLGAQRAAGEYLAGLTDRSCDEQYTQLVELGTGQLADW
jgi:dGTPase